MKKIFLLFLAAMSFVQQLSAQSVEYFITFERVDPLKKVFKESNFFPSFTEPAAVARGEYATFQFAVRSALPLNDLQFTVTPFCNDKGDELIASRVGFVDYVKASNLMAKPAHDAVVPLSNYYPDPIREVQNWSVGRDQAQPMWITLPIPEKTKAGTYKATVTLSGVAGDAPFSMKKSVAVKVYPVTLEKHPLMVSNWFSISNATMTTFNGGRSVKRYSQEYWAMVEELAQKLGECHTNTIKVPILDLIEFSEKSDKYTFDYTHFDTFIDIFKKAGILELVEGDHFAVRKGGWKSQFELCVPEYNDKGVKKIVKYPLGSEKAKDFYRQFIPSLKAHLKKKGLIKHYVQHIADEPIQANHKSYIEIAKFVKELWPDIKIIEACHTHNLENMVDIWVPQLNFYHKNYKFYSTQQKAGNEAWFYTCLSPDGDYLNRFVEQHLLKTRLIHWLNYRYGATGYLHWGFNLWSKGLNPYKEVSAMQLGGTTIPGGDCYIVYPNNGKLYSSIRLEAMRDGIADYTLLKMLEKKNPALAKKICNHVILHWTVYNMNNDHFRWSRKQVLEALSKK